MIVWKPYPGHKVLVWKSVVEIVILTMINYLQIPSDAKPVELINSVIWMDNGILYSKPVQGKFTPPSREQMEQDMIKFRQVTNGKKVAMIVEAHPQTEQPLKEDRDFIAEKLSEVTEAMAILTPNAVTRMVANLFFLFKPAPFPTKMFVSVSDAKAWLQDLKKNPRRHNILFAA